MNELTFSKLYDNYVFKYAMETMLEASYSGFIIIDKEGKIIYANKWYEEFTNIPVREYLGDNIDVLFKNSHLKRVLEAGVVERDQYDTRFKRPVLINRFPIYVDGAVIGAIAAFREIETVEKTSTEYRRQLAKKGFEAKYHFDDIITENQDMLKIKELAKIYAGKSSTILITGESGTGKELFAQSIHNYSDRKNMPFVAINCSTLTETILESELFGYADSSFTGAKKGGKIGLFQIAHKGTIFLDEIGEMPLSFQSKLLRVLQEKQIRPVGSDAIVPIDVRVIAATNKNLHEEVRKGNFRLDLYYRLNVLRLDLMPLRKRPEDIYPLSHAIMYRKDLKNVYIKHEREIKKILDMLGNYSFPGNIRELENMLERLSLMLESDMLKYSFEDMINNLKEPSFIPDVKQGEENTDIEKRIEASEKTMLIEKLLECKGNKIQTADMLGISIATLYRKLKKYNL